LLGIIIAATGIVLTDYQVGGAAGAYWDGVASITIGVVLAIVAFALARTSRGLLLGEAANRQTVRAIRKAIESHPNVEKVVELLTMHLAPKEILINAHVEMRDDLLTDQIVGTIEEVEALIKQAEPKVEKIFLEVARDKRDPNRAPAAEQVG